MNLSGNVLPKCIYVFPMRNAEMRCVHLFCSELTFPHIITFMSLDLQNMPCADIHSECRDEDSLKDL